ncbi:tetratricopeptide repeat-containing response regulator [Pleionea sp. CnH1-48]|uniref:tetratricopeptide repeat-containing response regulator n=1 Tax=Pleionea sp. CnH1-48 TaxID=2954494 RepID=UPI002096CF35|nr:tetratricopeptide repeat-containing response regulator [Pleionea sp. CnH1-48]MCO7223601.1 response regulator [Pleionea sp. CnH1-48]
MQDYSKKSVLIIEDFTEFARSVKAMLSEIGITKVEMVNNGEAAIKTCEKTSFDIILSDYNLGKGKDGMQVLEELHFRKRIRSDTAFIMITAENSQEMVMGALEHQPDAYLTKPFNNAILRSRLDKVLGKKAVLMPIFKAFDKRKWQAVITHCDDIASVNPKYKMACLRYKTRALEQLRQWDDLIDIYNTLLQERPLPWAIIGQGKAYMRKKDFDQAHSIFQDAIKQFPMLLEAYDCLAECQLQQGMGKEAQVTLESAIKKSPRAVKRQSKLGDVAVENEDFGASSKAFKKAVKLGRFSVHKNPDSYVKLASSVVHQLDAGDLEGQNLKAAVEDTEKVMKEFYDSYSGDSVSNLRGSVVEAGFLKAQGKDDAANKKVERAKELYQQLDTMLPADSGLEVAQGLKFMGEEEIAESILAETIERNFEDARFIKKASAFVNDKSILEKGKKANQLNTQGIKLFEQKNYDEAIQQFAKAVEQAPKNIGIILNAAQVLLKAHQSSKNTDYLTQCENYLGSIQTLPQQDKRYQRFSELQRMTRLLQQQETQQG